RSAPRPWCAPPTFLRTEGAGQVSPGQASRREALPWDDGPVSDLHAESVRDAAMDVALHGGRMCCRTLSACKSTIDDRTPGRRERRSLALGCRALHLRCGTPASDRPSFTALTRRGTIQLGCLLGGPRSPN